MAELIEEKSQTKIKTVSKPTPAQLRYLTLGIKQPGGKLPLFDRDGQRIRKETIRSCMQKGWCIPWFENPIKPDWVVCKLTDAGRQLLKSGK